ncbi:unnamed protein product [Orchesella dallaii]|uniref:Uncharacterized protein n=1 Tax=Orchesella dallaii TaxID=48710 RepID=A0ABP1QQR8_9HEXA
MQLRTVNNFVLYMAILLGIANSVYLYRPSVLLKRSLLRRRLLHMPINGTLRLKRQLFREDIPHHRPLSGNTYYLHAGFPHPSRWHDGPQTIKGNPNPITHHHLAHHHGHVLNDNGENQDNFQHIQQLNHNHQQHQNNELQNNHHNNHAPPPPPAPVIIETLDKNRNPLSVTIQSAIVHNNGVIDNSIVNQSPPPPPIHHHSGGGPNNYGPPIGHIHNEPRKKRPRPPKPHSDPEPYHEYDHPNNGPGDYDNIPPPRDYGPPPHSQQAGPPIEDHQDPSITKKPKTVIHYHPVQVGNIINFNDDSKPLLLNPNHEGYGPPQHIPGVPLAHKDVMMDMAEPFLKSPFKTVSGEPEYLSFPSPGPAPGPQYGPPDHQPGPPLDSIGIGPLVPSYGPPIKHEAIPSYGPPIKHEHHDPIPPYGVALPVLAHHFHAGALGHPHHHPPPPPKRQRGRGRGRHQHHLHYHHVHHHPPLETAESPYFEVKYPTYVVHGHAPKKFPFHSHPPHYRSRPQKFFHWGI